MTKIIKFPEARVCHDPAEGEPERRRRRRHQGSRPAVPFLPPSALNGPPSVDEVEAVINAELRRGRPS